MHDINHKRRGQRCQAKGMLQVAALSLAMALALQANAQSITGGLYGSTSEAGATVEVSREATGFNRTISVNSNGQYRLDQLSPGTYQVKVIRDGTPVSVQQVTVLANSSAAVPSASTAAATALETVTVTGSNMKSVINPIDVTTSELSSIYNADLIQDLPISQVNIYQLARLDSATSMGNRYAQIGGASETENRYYYNEFDTSYDVTGMGAITFPQVAVESTQLITGSGGLGWTSTTGGITSATLKQGSNEVHGGYSLYYTPGTSSFWRPRGQTRVIESNGRPSLLNSYNNYDSGTSQYVWGSGPSIKDRLFAYVMVGGSTGGDSTTYSSTTRSDYSSRRREGMINLTWNISDNQSLNVAAYKVRDKSLQTDANNDSATEWRPDQTTYTVSGNTGNKSNSKLIIANYNWRITDDLRWRVMAGTMRFDYNDSVDNAGIPYIGSYDYNTGISSVLSPGYEWEPTNYFYEKQGVKSDITWNVGDHEITLGGEVYSNNYDYRPRSNAAGYMSYELNTAPGWIWTGTQYIWNTKPNLMWDYVYSGGGAFKSKQRGVYLYDNWQISDNVRVNFGGRWDDMESLTAANESFLDLSIF